MQPPTRAESRARRAPSATRVPAASVPARPHPPSAASARLAHLLRPTLHCVAVFLAATPLHAHPSLPAPLLAFPATLLAALVLTLPAVPRLRLVSRKTLHHLPTLSVLHLAHLLCLLPALQRIGPTRTLLTLGAQPALRAPRRRHAAPRFALALFALALLAYDATGGRAPGRVRDSVLRSRAGRAVHNRLTGLSARYRARRARVQPPADAPLPDLPPERGLIPAAGKQSARRLLAIVKDEPGSGARDRPAPEAHAEPPHGAEGNQNETKAHVDSPPGRNKIRGKAKEPDEQEPTASQGERPRPLRGVDAILGVLFATCASLFAAAAVDKGHTISHDAGDISALHALVFWASSVVLLPPYVILAVLAHVHNEAYASTVLPELVPRGALLGFALLVAPVVLPGSVGNAGSRRAQAQMRREASRTGASGASAVAGTVSGQVDNGAQKNVALYSVVLLSVFVLKKLSLASLGFAESLTFSSFLAATIFLCISLLEPSSVPRTSSRHDPSRMEGGFGSGSGDLSALVSKSTLQKLYHVLNIIIDAVAVSLVNLRDVVVQAKSNKASWQVLNFLVLQSGMATVELIYASIWHSNGLISISADNFFCSIALAIGLLAIRVTSRKPSQTHTYGFSRFESVCGFANGIMLIYVAVLIVLEAFERFHDTENVATGHAFAVCLFGMTGNVLGLYFFPPETRRENHNVQGIYLHIWANTLAFASIAVSTAISAAVPAWELIDLLLSTLVGLGVITSAVPLIVRSARLLLLLVPVERKHTLTTVRSRLDEIDGVLQVKALRVWNLTPTCLVASVKMEVSGRCKGQDLDILYKARSVFASIGVPASQCTIQIYPVESEKPAVVFHKRTKSGFGDTGIDLELLTTPREQPLMSVSIGRNSTLPNS